MSSTSVASTCQLSISRFLISRHTFLTSQHNNLTIHIYRKFDNKLLDFVNIKMILRYEVLLLTFVLSVAFDMNRLLFLGFVSFQWYTEKKKHTVI